MEIKSLDHCGVEVVDVDIENLTDAEYKEIKNIFLDHLILVIRNQKNKTVPYAKLIQKLGNISNWKQCIWDKHGNRLEQFKEVNAFSYTGIDDNFPIQRVTGQLKDGKRTGIFGQGKLDWHSNMNGPHDRARGVALQGISNAVCGTSTSWMDTTKAYSEMPNDLKKRCEGVVGIFQYSPEIWAEGLSEDQYKNMIASGTNEYQMPLIQESFNGKKGLYFHYHNKCRFPTDPELLEILKDYCLQPKFIYKHMWAPGDIVISDQVLTLHKRDQDDPNILAERILSRYTFHFKKE